MTLRHAFKEWAAVCRALATGQQAILLRKGGIADPDGLFVPEHTRFWLYPTFVHQQQTGLKPEAAALLNETEPPPEGTIRLTHFAEIAGVYHIAQEFAALLLDEFHVLSEATIRARFAYRRPGLFVLPARVFAVPKPFEIPASPMYDGCKTWVELEQDLPTDNATPILSDAAFELLRERLDLLMNPTAFA